MAVSSIIAAGRRLVGTTLLDRCVLSERTTVRDSGGGRRETYVPRNSGRRVRCRFVRIQDDDPAINLDSVYGRAEAILLLPIGTVFREGDRVVNLTAATARPNAVWQIVGILTPPSLLMTVERAAIKEVV